MNYKESGLKFTQNESQKSSLVRLDRLSRRIFLSALGGGALVLTGCGGGSDSEGGEVVPAPPPAVREPGIFLLAGQLGGAGLLEGKGAEARLPGIHHVSITPDGFVYVPVGGSQLAKVSQDAQLSLIPGPTAGTDYRIAADAQGRLHAFAWACIYRQSDSGWTPIAGNPAEAGYADGDGASARIGYVTSPVLGADGSFYFIDKGTVLGAPEGMMVRKLTGSGQIVTVAGQQGVPLERRDGQGSEAGFVDLIQLLAQPDGSLLALDRRHFRSITLDGQVHTHSNANELLTNVSNLVQTSATTFYALEGSRVVQLGLDGSITPFVGIPDAYLDLWEVNDGVGEDARLLKPLTMVQLPDGDLLIGDDSYALRRIKLQTRKVSSWVGANVDSISVDGLGSNARFTGVINGMAVNAKGDIFVLEGYGGMYSNADAYRQVVRKIRPDGAVTTLPGKLSDRVTEIAADGHDNIFYASGCAIMQLKADGSLAVFAGNIEEKGYADGSALQARFASPRGLSFDQAGNLWVIDAPAYEYERGAVAFPSPRVLRLWYGQTLRRITPDGIVTTYAGTPSQVLERPFPDYSPAWQLWNSKVDSQGRIYLYSSGGRAAVYRIDGPGAEPSKLWASEKDTSDFEQMAISTSGQIFVSSTLPGFAGGSSAIYAMDPGGGLRLAAGSEALGNLGVRLGALPGALNWVYGLTALDDRTLVLVSESAVLRVNL